MDFSLACSRSLFVFVLYPYFSLFRLDVVHIPRITFCSLALPFVFMLKAFMFEPVAPSHRYPGLVPKWFSGGTGLVYSDLRRRVPNENKRDGHIVSKTAAAQQRYSTTPLSSVYRSALQSRPHVSPSPSVTPRRSCHRTRHDTQSPSVGERPPPCLSNVPPSLRILGQVSCEAGPWSGEPQV